MTMPQMPALPDLATANLSQSLDPVNLDQRLQALNGVTSSWGFPQLPDNVTFDLATSSQLTDTKSLSDFANGLAYDLNQAQAPEPVPLPAAPVQSQLSALYFPEDDPITRMRQMFSAVAGKPAPSLISDQAVVKIKQRAMAEGLITPDSKLDGSWSSQLNGVKYQLGQKDFQNRLQGERYGAVKTNKMMALVDQWTSPTGLLSAATALGFVPDFDKVRSETQNWGKKISDWWKHDRKNPLKMVQALSGPIDDIMFPVVNDVLLVSGVGNLVTFSRFAMASKALKGIDAVGDLATAGRFLTMGGDIVSDAGRAQRLFGLAINEAHAAAEIGRMATPGLISTKLMGSRFGAAELAGKGMAAWRNTTSTVIAKKAVQQGMKLGLLSNIEHGFQGEQVNPRFDFKSWAYGENTNPLTQSLATFGEIALTPSTILNRGAFTSPIKDSGALLRRKLTGLTTDQRIGAAFFRIAQEHVKYVDPKRYESMRAAMRGATDGVTRQQAGLMHLLGTDSPEEAGMRMYGVVLTSALNKWAKLKTLEAGLSPTGNADEWRTMYHTFRNKAIAQMRDLSDVAADIDNPRHRQMFASMRSHVAAADAATDFEKARAQAFRDVLAGLETPEGKAQALAELANHGAVRRGTWNEVMGTLDEADLAAGISENWDNLGRWHEYTVALDKVRTIDPSQVSVAAITDDFEDSWRWSALGESLTGAKPAADLDAAWVDDLSLQLNEGRGRVALAKLDTPTRQDAELLEAHVQSLLDQVEAAEPAAQVVLKRRLRDLNNSPIWESLKVEAEHTSIEAKLGRLRQVKRWVAKDVTVPGDLAQELHGMGYKPVYGVEFAFPHDVMDLMGPMPYIANSTMRKHSLGLFLGRDSQAHDLLQGLRQERFHNILTAEMKRIHGKDIKSDDILGLLRKGRNNIVDDAAKDAAHTEMMPLTNRVGARIKNAALPFSTYRLDEKQVAGILGDSFSKDEVKTIVASLRKAENVGFEYLGLQKLENDLVSNSWLRGALKAFGPSSAADGLGPVDRLRQEPASWSSWWKSTRQIVGVGQPGVDTTVARRVAGAAVLGTAAATQSDDNQLQSGALAAGLGAAFPRIISPKFMARAMMAQGVRVGADRAGLGETEANILGLAAPLGAMPLAAKVLSNPAWGQYSRLADKGRYLRDLYRFGLSPVWDVQRYTEGAMLNLTADLPTVAGKRVHLPVTTRPMRRAIEDTGMGRDEIVSQFKRYSGDFFDVDAVESAQKWFHEVGIMGFNPTEWMAASHAQLMRQGMRGEDAFEKTMQIYTYGVRGRSAAELSMNFVFFPFSFQKKYLGNMAKFLSQDLGRTVMLHDAMKMWSDLYERYNLDEVLADHVPIMQQMRKINALAFGISPGELGGINRPIYEMIHRAPVVNEVHDAIVNSFLPQAIKIDTQSWRDIQPHVKRMLPVWRDVEDLHQDLVEQRNVITSPSHLVSQKAAEKGWEEWRKINEEIDSYATALGTTYGGIMANEDYAFIKSQIDRKRAAVMTQYPEFVESRRRAAERAIQKQDEIKRIVAAPSGDDERAMGQFINYVEQYEDVMRVSGIDLTNDIEAVPAFVFDALRRRAIVLGKDNPGFNRLYRIYYSGLFGPIEYQVV